MKFFGKKSGDDEISATASSTNGNNTHPPPVPTARSLDYDAPHHGHGSNFANFANPASRMPASTSLSISRLPKSRHERTHILAQNQNPTTPARQLACPVNASQSQPESQPAF
jgi:hypothetical protein